MGNNTKHYTLGNKQLYVATDHKPLVKIFGDKDLGEIPNPRLARLKEATLRWDFSVLHVPGATNAGPDALSRRRVGQVNSGGEVLRVAGPTCEEEDEIELREAGLVALAVGSLAGLVTVEDVKEAGEQDEVMVKLRSQVQAGFPPDRKLLVEGMVMFKERVVIPAALRKVVLETLHSAHQGVYTMQLRADKSVWWPGLASDIRQARNKCVTCHEIAPTQPRGTPVKTQDPEYLFQMVCAEWRVSNTTFLRAAGITTLSLNITMPSTT